MSIPPKIQIVNNSEHIYLDINTRQVAGLNTNVSGTNNNFRAEIKLDLDENIDYIIEVLSFTYENPTPTASQPVGVQPIILSDISEPIIVNGFTSSVLFKSNQIVSTTPSTIVSDISNNINFKRNVKYHKINSIAFEIIRSDNGQPFIFTNANDNVNVILKITNN